VNRKTVSAVVAAVVAIALVAVALWLLSRPAPSPAIVSRPPPVPVSPTPAPIATPPPIPQPPEGFPSIPPPPVVPEGDLRRDPKERQASADKIRSMRIPQNELFFAPFFDAQGFTPEQRKKFAGIVVEQEVWMFDRCIYPEPGAPFPIRPTTEEVFEKRRQVIVDLRKEFGDSTIDAFLRAFPGSAQP